MNRELFNISEPGDWTALRELGADVVLDPVVVRIAHLFLLGRSGTNKPDEVWKALESNIGTLATFVDAIVLRERIPVFNYGTSWDDPRAVPTGSPPPVRRPEPAELLEVCGAALTPVHIAFKSGPSHYQGEYFDLVTKADAQARDHAPLPPALVRQVVSRLRTYDFGWEPRKIPANVPTNELTPVLQSYREQLSGPDTDAGMVKRYLTGCLVFSGFAQKLGGEHVVPPDWSRLYAAAALPEDAEEGKEEAKLAEEALFRRLAEAGNTNQLQIGRTVQFEQPTFLPYLLDRKDTQTPEALFRRAIAMRESDEVRQYLDFRRQVREEARHGRPETYLRKINELVAAAERIVSKAPRHWPIKMHGSLSIPGGLSGGADVGKELDLFRAYDWSMRQLPSNGYRKLLLRLIVAQQQTSLLAGPVCDRWEAAG